MAWKLNSGALCPPCFGTLALDRKPTRQSMTTKAPDGIDQARALYVSSPSAFVGNLRGMVWPTAGSGYTAAPTHMWDPMLRFRPLGNPAINRGAIFGPDKHTPGAQHWAAVTSGMATRTALGKYPTGDNKA